MSKLVRDHIPQIIKQNTQKIPSYHRLNDIEFLNALTDKLMEEAQELRATPIIEELADVMEVVRCVQKQLKISDTQLKSVQDSKRKEKGGYDQHYLLDNLPVKHLPDTMLIQKCLLIQNQKILALHRPPGDKSRPNCWDLPGGGYEKGESVTKSIAREVKEEAGLVIHNPKPIYFDNKIMQQDGLYFGDHVFAVCYQCREWEGEVTISDEHIEYRWVTPQEFLKLDFGEDGGFFTASIKALQELSPII